VATITFSFFKHLIFNLNGNQILCQCIDQMLKEKVFVTRYAQNQSADGVEATIAGLLLVFFSFLSYMSIRFNFVDQTLEAHVFVILEYIYL